MNKREITYLEAIREAITEEFERNPSLVVFGEDILDEKRKPTLGDLKKKYPDRIMNHVPLVEDMLGGIGLGMSLGGLTPIVQLDYATFLPLALDGIYRLATWRYRMGEEQNPGVVFRVSSSMYLGCGPEFSTSLLATLFHLPNLWIAAPLTPFYAKGLMKTALRARRPVIFFEEEVLYDRVKGMVAEENVAVPFGTSHLLGRGADLTFISWLRPALMARDAALKLAQEGKTADVIALQTLNPLDMDAILASARKTGRVVIAEEDMLRGGIGAELAARITETLPHCRIRRVAARDTVLPARAQYEKLMLPDEEKIYEAARSLLVR